METKAKQRFFNMLSNVFIGDVEKKIEGNSGYTNLMNIRNIYFKQMLPKLQEKINESFGDEDRDELYIKLYTFFESYLNETGTPFYNKTEIHKNLYEKVYSDREDVSLFWKTQKLYYVKSEAMYTSAEFKIDGINFSFDASQLEHAQNYEKKNLTFLLAGIDNENVKFKLFYDNTNKANEIVKKVTKIDSLPEARLSIFKQLDEIVNGTLVINKNDLNLDYFYKSDGSIHITNVKNKGVHIFHKIQGLFEQALVEIGLIKIKDIEDYMDNYNIEFNIDVIKKAVNIYKRQKEIDYFISKDAENFLKEQFNIYMYNYLFNDEDTKWIESPKRIDIIQKIKEIAFECIEKIAKMEEELKAIWLKPKFARNSNYVLTLDKLKDNIELIEKIIKSKGFSEQEKEWKCLYENKINSDGEEIKKQWKEFEFIKDFDKNKIINEDGKLNEVYKHLPLDTRNFKNLEGEILDCFDNLDEKLDGVLIKSDNYQALNTISKKYKGDVDLIYIDPPFNTGDDFDYKDDFQDSTWLTLMDNRIDLAKHFLSEVGTFYLHIDYNANHYAKFLMQDHNFKYRNEIIWHFDIGTAPKYDLKRKHNVILRYSKGEDVIFNENRKEALNIDRYKQTDENGRKYMIRGDTGKIVYADEGQAEDDVWTFISSNSLRNLNSMSNERTGFKTQKPEYLISKFINISTRQNSKVMDFFSGSGSTIATAHKMNKSWIGIEMGKHFYSLIIPRMKKVLIGDSAGISKDDKFNWQGGGFFKYYELEQYEDVLRNSKYNTENSLSLTLYNSEKLLDCIKIEDETVKLDFKILYSDVDIAETISNLTGNKIKKVNDKRVIYEDGTEIVFDDIKWDENKNLRPLFWWGEMNE